MKFIIILFFLLLLLMMALLQSRSWLGLGGCWKSLLDASLLSCDRSRYCQARPKLLLLPLIGRSLARVQYFPYWTVVALRILQSNPTSAENIVGEGIRGRCRKRWHRLIDEDEPILHQSWPIQFFNARIKRFLWPVGHDIEWASINIDLTNK